MADTAISGLNSIGAVNTGDLFVAVDVTDTTMGVNGSDKKVTFAQLLAFIAATVSADGTMSNTGVLKIVNTNGAAFAASATVNALNASNINTGTLSASLVPTTGLTLTQFGAAITTDTPVNGNWNCNLATSNIHQATLAANTTIVLSNPTNGQQFTVFAQQAATNGPYGLTFFSGVVWFNSPFAAPTMPQTANGVLAARFAIMGTNSYYGWWLGNNST